jgi:hypothetical protein
MVMLLTIIIVASGFLGRYIYTAVPRNADGIEFEANDLELQLRVIDDKLESWLATQPELYQSLSKRLSPSVVSSGHRLVFGRAFEEWNARLRWWRASSQMDGKVRVQAKQRTNCSSVSGLSAGSWTQLL